MKNIKFNARILFKGGGQLFFSLLLQIGTSMVVAFLHVFTCILVHKYIYIYILTTICRSMQVDIEVIIYSQQFVESMQIGC